MIIAAGHYKEVKAQACFTNGLAIVEVPPMDDFAIEAAQSYGFKLENVRNANGETFGYRFTCGTKEARKFLELCQ